MPHVRNGDDVRGNRQREEMNVSVLDSRQHGRHRRHEIRGQNDIHRLAEGSNYRNQPAPVPARLDLPIDWALQSSATRHSDVLRIRIFP